MRIYQSVVKLPTILTALSQYEGSKVQLLSNLVISPLKVRISCIMCVCIHIIRTYVDHYHPDYTPRSYHSLILIIYIELFHLGVTYKYIIMFMHLYLRGIVD